MIKKIFMSDNALRIYSVIIAIILWAVVVYDQNPESTKLISGVNVYYTNLDTLQKAGYTILQSGQQTIDITVKGKRLSIGKVNADNVSAFMTIPEIRAGEFDVAIDAKLPLGDVTITDKNPYTAKVIIEPIMNVQLPVEIVYSGNKSASTAVETTVSPETVTMWGPESVIDKVKSLKVNLNYDELGSDIKQMKKYHIYDAEGNDMTDNININVNTDTVSIQSNVFATTDTPITPAFIGELPDGYAISDFTVTPSTIRLGSKDGAHETITQIKTDDIDLSGVTESKTYTLRVQIPSGFANVDDIETVKVEIKIEKASQHQISISDIAIESGDANMKYSIANLPVTVTVNGSESAIKGDIKASVNVSGLVVGTHSLPLNLSLPTGVTQVGSAYVSITVSK